MATQTSASPERKRSISSRLDASGIAPYSTATRPGCNRFTSPASASTAFRLKATTTVPVPSERSVRSPTHSSGSIRSKTLSSASGKARSTSGSASSAPRRRISRYSPASISRVQADPRSSSSAHWTSSSTRSSPDCGAISTVQHTIGAPSLTRSSPVIERDVLEPDALAETAMRLLREHPQRPGVDACTLGDELVERRVRLSRVGRAQMRDDALGLAARARGARSRSAARRAGRRFRSYAGGRVAERLGRFCRPRGGRRWRIRPR